MSTSFRKMQQNFNFNFKKRGRCLRGGTFFVEQLDLRFCSVTFEDVTNPVPGAGSCSLQGLYLTP